jgi:protein phosphatase
VIGGDIVVSIRAPALVALIGAAGSGKTTLARRLFDPGDVISSDELRGVVSGDPSDQRATRPAFAILLGEVARRLAAGRVTVVDATSVERAARRALLRVAVAAGADAVAIVLALPRDLVHARNASRTGRPVPPEIVDRHLARLASLTGLGPAGARATLIAEGFRDAYVVASDDEIARLRVDRV